VPFLIVSDIHANLEALEAVLEDAHGRYDRILCLGDLVGYGADPNAIVEWARASVRCIVRGNHDKAGAGEDPLYIYNANAQAALEWTHSQLTPESLAYLQALPRGPLRTAGECGPGFDLAHGSPLDEDDYLISAGDAALLRRSIERILALPDQTRLFMCHDYMPGGREVRWANAFIVAQGERFILFNEHGNLIIASLTPTGYKEISRANILEPTNTMAQTEKGRKVIWSHPAFADRCVFARNDKEIVCVSLAKQEK